MTKKSDRKFTTNIAGFFVTLIVIVMFGCSGKQSQFKIIERSNGKGIMQEFYPDGKLQYESEVDIANKNEPVRNGYEKEYYESGKLATLSFYKNDSPDERRNVYVYLENGRLDYIAHDTVTIKVNEHNVPVNWKGSKIFNIYAFAVHTNHVANIANIFRVFVNVSTRLHMSIVAGNGKVWFDSTRDFKNPAPKDDYPDCAVIFTKLLPANDSFTYLADYTLIDSISGMTVESDTIRVPIEDPTLKGELIDK